MLTAGTERFESFAKNSNLGFATVQDIKGSEVYNTVTNKLKEVSTDLKDMVSGLTQSAKMPLKEIDDKINENVRAVKDVFTTLEDTTKLSVKEIESSIAEFLPNDPVIQNTFRSLTAQCRNSTMGQLPGFKPFNDNGSCGSPGDGKCSTGQVSGFLNKLTGGAIGSIAKSLNSMLRTLMTLANLGYSGGLCKIFATLTNNLPDSIVQRGAAGVLAIIGGKGNTKGVMDIASSLIGKKGINVSREISGLTGRITDNFKIPGDIKSSQLGGLYAGFTSALDVIKPGYDKSDDGLYSLANMGGKLSNSDYKKTASAWLAEDAKDAPLDKPYAPQGYQAAAAYIDGSYYPVPAPRGGTRIEDMAEFYIR